MFVLTKVTVKIFSINQMNGLVRYRGYRSLTKYCNYQRRIWDHVKHFTTWKVSVFGVFLVLNFPHSNWIWRDTPYLSVFCLNTGKYGPEKLRIRTLFTHRLRIFFWKRCPLAFMRTSQVSASELTNQNDWLNHWLN